MTLRIRATTIEGLTGPELIQSCDQVAKVVVMVYETKGLDRPVGPGVRVRLAVRCGCPDTTAAEGFTDDDGHAAFVIASAPCGIAGWDLQIAGHPNPILPLGSPTLRFDEVTVIHALRPRGILQVDQVQPFDTWALGEGTPPSRTLRISNGGNGPLTLESVTVPTGVFRLSSEERGTVLDPGESVEITVDATPTSADAVQRATITVVSTAGNGTADLEAGAYELRDLEARTSPIAPDVDDADIHYTIVDPTVAVGQATISIHEIDRATDAIGREIATFPGLPHVAGDNAFSWRGAVTHPSYEHGFVTWRGRSYRVKLVIARTDGRGPLERTYDVEIKDVGELMVTLQRHDGAALAGNATIELENLTTHVTTVHTTQARANPNRGELVVKGLDPADYEVRLLDAGAYLGAEGLARISPDQTGRARAAVRVGERARVALELTPYTKVQLVGFHATPTGTNRSLAAPTVMATYKGEPDDRQDMLARCELMKQAMSEAELNDDIDDGADVLKVLMAPEFFFRGQGGGYPLEIVEEILPELLREAQQPKYDNWLFVYGTAIGYLRHGEAVPERYELRITATTPGAAPRVRVQMDPTLPRDRRCSVKVCERIPWGHQMPREWKLQQGASTASIFGSTPISADEFELVLQPGSAMPALGPVELIEPLSTEVFNMALIQRGGPSPGGKRERLVAKEYVSSIDFLGRHHPAVDGNFYVGHATHLADIHHDGEELIVPTLGSSEPLSAPPSRNPAVTGGTSEHDKSGLGGGALFSMAGINFGMAVCLDHLAGRLNTYLANATPGDPVPQVHLIPSWGMEIASGPIYTVANGVVFNVDGRQGCPPDAGTFNGQHRCPDHVHNPVAYAAPATHCTQAHYECGAHGHFEAAANCSRCGTAMHDVYRCTALQHLFFDPVCPLCGDGLALFGYWCETHGLVAADPCPDCGGPTEEVYECTRASHLLATAAHEGSCGVAAPGLYGLKYCPAPHEHTQYAAGNCSHCAVALTLVDRKLENDWDRIDPLVADVAVPDPAAPRVVNEQTVMTTTVVKNAVGDVLNEHTTVAPPNTPPLAIPSAAPATDHVTTPNPGVTLRVRTWNEGPFTVTSTEQVTTVVGPVDTTETTVVTTRRTGTVTGRWANLFAEPGSLRIYPVSDLPPATVV